MVIAGILSTDLSTIKNGPETKLVWLGFFKNPYNKVTVWFLFACLFEPNDLANRWTDKVLI